MICPKCESHAVALNDSIGKAPNHTETFHCNNCGCEFEVAYKVTYEPEEETEQEKYNSYKFDSRSR